MIEVTSSSPPISPPTVSIYLFCSVPREKQSRNMSHSASGSELFQQCIGMSLRSVSVCVSVCVCVCASAPVTTGSPAPACSDVSPHSPALPGQGKVSLRPWHWYQPGGQSLGHTHTQSPWITHCLCFPVIIRTGLLVSVHLFILCLCRSVVATGDQPWERENRLQVLLGMKLPSVCLDQTWA